jgi:hypothetical protein
MIAVSKPSGAPLIRGQGSDTSPKTLREELLNGETFLQDCPRLNRIQATSTKAVRACMRRVAGCAMPTGFVGHAGATGLTFHLDRSVGLIKALSPIEASTKRSCAFEGDLNVGLKRSEATAFLENDSSSASRFTAGAFEIFILGQSGGAPGTLGGLLH